MGKKIEEILACHWSDSRNTGFLLAETAEFLKNLKIYKVLCLLYPLLYKDPAFRVHLPVLHHWVLRAVLNHAVT